MLIKKLPVLVEPVRLGSDTVQPDSYPVTKGPSENFGFFWYTLFK